MIEIGLATEDEMILAFLKAEIESPRFGPIYLDVIARSRLSRANLIDNADLRSVRDNQFRMGLLRAVRGYRADQYLFRGFPPTVRWHRVRLDPVDLGLLKYANFPTWSTLSAGTRLVVDGAKNIDTIQTAENVNAGIKTVTDEIRRGRKYPELIAVEGGSGFLVLVEGHSRATAYALAPLREPIEVFVGISPAMIRWAFY